MVDEKITRAQANEHIIATGKRWCRGVPLHTPQQTAGWIKQYEGCKTLKERIDLKNILENKFKLAHVEVTNDNEAHARIMPLIYSYPDTVGNHRATCGQDTNELIIADGKFDGETHTVTCPRCGQPQIYRVLFNLSD